MARFTSMKCETRRELLHLAWFGRGSTPLNFKKVNGPVPASVGNKSIYQYVFNNILNIHSLTARDGVEGGAKNRSPSPSLSSLPDDAPYAKILRLLRAPHQLNTWEAERSVFSGDKRNLPEAAFVNNKLTAKLTRQLEEPMIVARQAYLYLFFLNHSPY